MTQNTKLFLLYSFPVSVLLLSLRYYLVSQTGFPDYDSVRNWDIVQQISTGNFQYLYHHASPSFFLFYSALAPLISNFHVYVYINALFNLAALIVFTRFWQRILYWKPAEAALFLLLSGSAVFLVYSARFFTIESPSLLLFALFLQAYYKRFSENSDNAFYRSFLILAFALTINYKFLPVFPIIIFLEVIYKDGFLTLKKVRNALLILAAPFILYALFSLFLDGVFYRFPIAFLNQIDFNDVNAANRTGRFRPDIFYYFQYFIAFEIPLLVSGFVGFMVLYRNRLFARFNAFGYSAWIGYAFLGGMSLLLKAPRALILAYPIFYLILFLVLRRLVTNRLTFAAIILVLAGYNIWKIQKEIYVYTPTNYPEVAAYLKEYQVKKVAGTVGLGLKPFLDKGITYKGILKPEELAQLKKDGYEYLLLDDYRKITNIKNFEGFEKFPSVLKVTEPTLQSGLLFLEHSEFTGLNYSETMHLREKAMADTLQLKLIRIP